MPRTRCARRLTIAAAVPLALASCGDPTRVCPSDLRTRVSPTALALAVGESATATAEALGCGGTEVLAETFLWTSADTLIARVDAATGRVTGRAPGSTMVLAAGRAYHGRGEVIVTVE